MHDIIKNIEAEQMKTDITPSILVIQFKFMLR